MLKVYNDKIRSPISVVHIFNRLEIGGVEAGILNLIKRSTDIDYMVIAIKGCDENIYRSLSDIERSKIIVCNGYLSSIFKLWQFRRKIIVSSLWRGHLVTNVLKLFSNISHVHFCHNTSQGHFINRFVSFVSINTADYIFSDSIKTKCWIKRYYNIDDVTDIPMNVTFRKEKPKMNPVDLKFVFCGRIAEQKNLPLSLYFISALVEHGLHPVFDIYGRDEGLQSSLEYLVDDLGLDNYIRFLGPLLPTEVEEKMSEYSFYLQTSNFEGMSISVYQSLKSNLIPVVTPVGEISKYTEHMFNAFHLDINDVAGSFDNFLNCYDNGMFSSFNIGEVVNEECYPTFDESFFLALKCIKNNEF